MVLLGVALLGVARPIWENISGVRFTPVDGSRSRLQG